MARENTKKLIVVVGPTAVGKTKVAIELAKYHNTEILSADSRQFYQELAIGTARPSASELAAVPHHFIASKSITENYSAGDFEQEALATLNRLFQHHDHVVLVGGSGLFVRAVCEGLDDLPQAPAEIREQLNTRYEAEGLIPLQNWLLQIDPLLPTGFDIQNPQRVIRALEVYETTGRPISYYQRQQRESRPFEVITIGLNTDRERLYQRINARVDQMLADGLVNEAKSVLPFRNQPALRTVGYKELFDYFDGKHALPDAIEKIKQNSRQYAKRQITWFKKYGETKWFTPEDLVAITDYIAPSSGLDESS